MHSNSELLRAADARTQGSSRTYAQYEQHLQHVSRFRIFWNRMKALNKRWSNERRTV